MGRRDGKTKADKKAEKAAYDAEYRAKNGARIKQYKKELFQRTYDPVKAAIERKARMPRHIEYCRQPAYRRWKKEYDEKYKAKQNYGPFAESYLLLRDIEGEVGKRMTDYEIRIQQGTLNKMQRRKRRLYEKTSSN